MNPITQHLQPVCRKAILVAAAYESNQDAYMAYTLARNSHNLKNAETIWENTRDTIITLLRGLLTATQALLAISPTDSFKALRKAATQMQDAFDAEAAAFDTYSNASGGDRAKREALETRRRAVIRQGWPLLERIQGLNCGVNLTGTGWHATQYFDQVEGLAAIGKPSLPPPPDPLAVRDESTVATDLDGAVAHNS